MKHGLTLVFTLTTFCIVSSFAEARPPTVMNSPGYDARLQESRKTLDNKALDNSSAPNVPAPAVTPRRTKTKRAN